jgi:hypothetical protein
MLPKNIETLRFIRNWLRVLALGLGGISLWYSFDNESNWAGICRTIALISAILDWPFEAKVRDIERIERAAYIGKISELEARLTPRHLLPNQRVILINGLRKVSEELVKHPEIQICRLSVSTEALEYAEEIKSAFIDAGIDVSDQIGAIPMSAFRGVFLCGTRQEVNDAFIAAGIRLRPDPRPFFPIRGGCFVWVGEKEDESQNPKPKAR